MKNWIEQFYKIFKSKNGGWITVASLVIIAGCTQISDPALYSRYFRPCFVGMSSCGCPRSVARILVPPTRQPQQNFQDLTPYIQTNPANGALLHTLSDPIYGSELLWYLPGGIPASFYFQNRLGLPVYRDGTPLRNYFALNMRSRLTLQGWPAQAISQTGLPFSLEGAQIYLGAMALGGGVKLTATQGGITTTVIDHPGFVESKFYCNTSRAFTLSENDSIEIEMTNNMSRGNIDDPAWISIGLNYSLVSLNPQTAFCDGGGVTGGIEVYAAHDPRHTNQATLALLAQMGWFGIEKSVVQPTAADKAEFGINDCPFPY